MRGCFFVLFSVVLFSGCATPAVPPVDDDDGKRAAIPAEPVTDKRMARGDFAAKSAAGSVAAQATIRRLQANDPLLSVAVKSRLANDSADVAALAGTVILQTTAVQRSSASFATYRVGAIEIHALPDGRVRVWAEFTNDGKEARARKCLAVLTITTSASRRCGARCR